MLKKVDRNKKRKQRHLRIRRKIHGTPDRPRLNVYRSLNHIYAQVIDDINGNTIVAASTLDPEVREEVKSVTKKEAAKKVGKLIAKRALDKGIESVVFDRGGYIYHGRVKELAEGVREGGLKF